MGTSLAVKNECENITEVLTIYPEHSQAIYGQISRACAVCNNTQVQRCLLYTEVSVMKGSTVRSKLSVSNAQGKQHLRRSHITRNTLDCICRLLS